jgi:hypothetical protein
MNLCKFLRPSLSLGHGIQIWAGENLKNLHRGFLHIKGRNSCRIKKIKRIPAILWFSCPRDSEGMKDIPTI